MREVSTWTTSEGSEDASAERAGREARHRLSRWFTKGVIAVMGLCVGGLSFMIALRLQIPQAQQAMDYFTSLNWSDYLPFDTWFRQDEVQSVASMGQYEAVGEHRYHNGTNEATAVCEGIIVHIEAQNETYCVTMKSDDGVMINFANLQEAAVQEDERIRSGAAWAHIRNMWRSAASGMERRSRWRT